MGRALGERNAGGVVEDGSNVSVDLDELVGLHGDSLISLVDLALHPFLEVAIGECCEDVDNPLLWQPGALLGVQREVGLELLVPVNVGVDLPEPEAFVLGHVAVGDLVLSDELLASTDDVLQEI